MPPRILWEEIQKIDFSRSHKVRKKSLCKRIFEWIPQEDNVVFNFCRESSLHGLKYLGLLNIHLVTRIIWLIPVVVLGFLSIRGMVQVLEKFYASPVMVSFQPFEINLEQIPFPAVTICSINNIRKSKVLKAMERRRTAEAGSLEAIDALLDLYYMQTICDNAATFSGQFNYSRENVQISNEDKALIQDQYKVEPNVTKMVAQTMQSCSDMIKLCSWNSKPQKCEKLFHQIYTDFGPCCVFNMMPIQLLLTNVRKQRYHNVSAARLKKWESWNIDRDILAKDAGSIIGPPRHQRMSGRAAGLSFLVDPEVNEYFCPSQNSVGFQLTTDSPLDYPKVKDFGLGVKTNSETFFDIRPELTMIDQDIQDLALSKRHCYFSGEYNLTYFKFYTIKNCLEECLSDYTYLVCNCTLFNMPRGPDQKVCLEDSHHVCARKAESEMSSKSVKEKCKKCRPECTQIDYEATMTQMPMSSGEQVWRYRNSESFAPWLKDNVSVIHVYFGSDTVYSRVRQRIFDSSDLVGNAGGILGLYLGFSFVSALEIIYHFIFKFCFKQDENGQYVLAQTFRKLKGSDKQVTNVAGKAECTEKRLTSFSQPQNKKIDEWTIGKSYYY